MVAVPGSDVRCELSQCFDLHLPVRLEAVGVDPICAGSCGGPGVV